MLIPLVSMAASVTLLPALLSVLGKRINRLRVIPRRVLERRASGERRAVVEARAHRSCAGRSPSWS